MSHPGHQIACELSPLILFWTVLRLPIVISLILSKTVLRLPNEYLVYNVIRLPFIISLILCLQEPFILNRCVVTVDPEAEGAFELSDLSKEPYIFKVYTHSFIFYNTINLT